MLRIMIVEDEKIIRSGLKHIIEDIIGNYKVVKEAKDGVEALFYLEIEKIDVVITDIRMKNMDGIELIKRIRLQNSSIPIIIISGYPDFEYAKQAIKYNVNDYILKPIDRIELALALHSAQDLVNKHKNSNQTEEKNQRKKERKVIRRAKEYIENNIHEQISLHYVADLLQLNYQYFSALFKMETGYTFSEYVTNVRIEKAKQLLSQTNMKIYNIASMCGYSNVKHFMNVFKKSTGMTPSEFRDNSV